MELKTRDVVHKALYVRMFNTLHGFNCLTDDAELILGILHWPKEDDHPISIRKNNTFGDEPSLETCNEMIVGFFSSLPSHNYSTNKEVCTHRYVSTSYGGTLLAIPISIRQHADILIKFVREMGFHIKLQTKLNPWYAATNVDFETFSKLKHSYRLGPVNWQPFSKEASEQIALFAFQINEHMISSAKLSQKEKMNIVLPEDKAWLLGDARLWCSTEGKEFAKKVKQLYTSEVEDHKPLVLYDQPILSTICPYDFPSPIKISERNSKANAAAVSTAAKFVSKQNDEKKKEETEGMCVICLGARANTLVEPCGHSVVCDRCSDGLKRSNDAKTCVQCRKPITFVTSLK